MFQKFTAVAESTSGEKQSFEIKPLVEKVLTKEEQAKLSPKELVKSLIWQSKIYK